MMRVGVAIPTLQEEDGIAACIEAVRALPGQWKIVVADGGSHDQTRARARLAGADQVLKVPASRGAQLRAAAAALLADPAIDALLFLHCDCLLPKDAHTWIQQTAPDPRWSAGAFYLRHECSAAAGPLARRIIRIANFRSRRTAFPYGDQAVFVSRENYEAAGGMPDQPLMEDLEFARCLNMLGPIRRIPSEVMASARRFEAKPIRTVLKWWTFPLLYRFGVSATRLRRWY